MANSLSTFSPDHGKAGARSRPDSKVCPALMSNLTLPPEPRDLPLQAFRVRKERRPCPLARLVGKDLFGAGDDARDNQRARRAMDGPEVVVALNAAPGGYKRTTSRRCASLRRRNATIDVPTVSGIQIGSSPGNVVRPRRIAIIEFTDRTTR
jgi:hypothetical protein